jgi:hypothetical protein
MVGLLVGLLVAAQRPERLARPALLEPLDPDDDLAARIEGWRGVLPSAAVRLIAVRPGGALVAEDNPAALVSALRASTAYSR